MESGRLRGRKGTFCADVADIADVRLTKWRSRWHIRAQQKAKVSKAKHQKRCEAGGEIMRTGTVNKVAKDQKVGFGPDEREKFRRNGDEGLTGRGD
jgi:hypothetical protein